MMTPEQKNEAKLILEGMYLVDHMTLAEIGEKMGLTRQGVHSRMRRLGVDTSRGERFRICCDACDKEYEITRARWRTSKKHYCSRACTKGQPRPNPGPRLQLRRGSGNYVVGARSKR